MRSRSQVKEVIDAGNGILRLEPCWVPRSFMIPGRRLKLHPDDLYAFGGHRGGINERFSGRLTTDHRALVFDDRARSFSMIVHSDRPR